MLQEPRTSPWPQQFESLERRCAQARETAHALNRATAAWHAEAPIAHDVLLHLHAANFELWHLEDAARDPRSTDHEIAATKRLIDAVNQRRNDAVEAIDTALLAALHARTLLQPAAPLHSETPGQMLDRLSILSLKLFHTELESTRIDASQAHRDRNLERLSVLQEQQADLADCLAALWSEVVGGTRRFKLYRQLKMYNDPALNPVLYAAVKLASEAGGEAPAGQTA